ncbi:MAG: hypothetical protein ABL879_10140, partial [Devosia sp.]
IYSTVDPATDGHAYSCSKYLSALSLTGSDCVIEDLETEGAGHQDGNVVSSGARTAMKRCKIKHGSRHGSLFGPNASFVEDTWIGGRNRQEAGGADQVVIYVAATFGGSDGATFTDCVNQGEDTAYLDISGDNVSGVFAHDGSNAKLPGTILHTRGTFRDNLNGNTPSAVTTQYVSPVLAGAKRLVGDHSGNADVTITDASGSVGAMFLSNFSSGIQTISTARSAVTIDGSRHATSFKGAVISQNGGGDLNWIEDHDAFTWTGSAGFRAVSQVAKGSITRYDSSFAGTLQAHDKLAEGNASGDVEFFGDRNTYKSGIGWSFKDQNPANLTAWKALVTPADANSVAL